MIHRITDMHDSSQSSIGIDDDKHLGLGGIFATHGLHVSKPVGVCSACNRNECLADTFSRTGKAISWLLRERTMILLIQTPFYMFFY
jgi:hypothetical protein